MTVSLRKSAWPDLIAGSLHTIQVLRSGNQLGNAGAPRINRVNDPPRQTQPSP